MLGAVLGGLGTFGIAAIAINPVALIQVVYFIAMLIRYKLLKRDEGQNLCSPSSYLIGAATEARDYLNAYGDMEFKVVNLLTTERSHNAKNKSVAGGGVKRRKPSTASQSATDIGSAAKELLEYLIRVIFCGLDSDPSKKENVVETRELQMMCFRQCFQSSTYVRVG